MGNLIFLSRRNGAAVTDALIAAALARVNTQRFRGQLGTVRIPGHYGAHYEAGWHVTAPQSTADWTLWRDTARRLQCKHAVGAWNRWVQELVLRHLAVALDLRMSDEGVNDPPWRVQPRDLTKIRTYRRWLETEYNSHGSWRAYMRYVPTDWYAEAAAP